jgi:hypothetical protein
VAPLDLRLLEEREDKELVSCSGQQPFDGARGSGTNDKTGSILNLVRWISPRTIKETFALARARSSIRS